MASFEPRGNSIRVVVRLPGGGKDTKTFDNTKAGEREAREWASQMDRKKASGASAAVIKGTTCADLWDAYETQIAHTDSARMSKLRLLAFQSDPLAKLPIGDVTTDHIDQWIARRLTQRTPRGTPVLPSTVAREINLMSASFNWAIEKKKWIKDNPCHGARALPKSIPRKPAGLTMEKVQAVCSAAGLQEDPELRTVAARTCVAWMLSLETGMRSGEVLRVRPEHYWRDRRTLRVAAEERGGRKGSKSGTVLAGRNVPLTERAIELLDWLLRTMPAKQGGKGMEGCGMLRPPYIVGLTDQQRDANWRIISVRAGLEGFTYHDSKHEACTRLSKFLDVIALSHAVGTKDLALLRDTYYINDASGAAALLPRQLVA